MPAGETALQIVGHREPAGLAILSDEPIERACELCERFLRDVTTAAAGAPSHREGNQDFASGGVPVMEGQLVSVAAEGLLPARRLESLVALGADTADGPEMPRIRSRAGRGRANRIELGHDGSPLQDGLYGLPAASELHDMSEEGNTPPAMGQIDNGIAMLLGEIRGQMRELIHSTNNTSMKLDAIGARVAALEAEQQRRAGANGALSLLLKSPALGWLVGAVSAVWALATGRIHL